jgi:GT2 family glycosyltransferase
VDFCRRMGEISKLLYYPKVKVFHNYEKGSYKDKRLLVYHIKSAVKYFNKWGWVFDKARYSRNQETLISLHYKK